MFNPKLISLSAAVGFVLSFLAGLIAGVPFGTVILRAFISAVSFAAVFYAGWFVYTKFLFQNTGETQEETARAAPGSLVDITIDDEPLPDDGSSPSFYVENPVQHSAAAGAGTHKHNDIIQPKSPAADSGPAQPAAAGFVPVQLGSSHQAHEKTASRTETAAEHHHSQVHEHADDEELDDLPDISSIIPDLKSSPRGSSENMTVSEVHESGEHKIEVSSITSSQDSTVMAQTIRTMLLKDG